MNDHPIKIEHIALEGFRAYLKEQSFPLREGGNTKSLAVFAPNAMGKSSLVDALEFFFSEEGTLKRLGLRRSGTQAGPQALEHVKAKDEGNPCRVTLSFRTPNGQFEGIRESGEDSGRPEAAQRVLSQQKLDFIIRGYELRSFVEEQTPQERFEEMSSWFGFGSIAGMLRRFRELRLKVKNELDENRATEERLNDLRRLTGGGVKGLDKDDLLCWVNENVVYPLDPDLRLKSLDRNDPHLVQLKSRKEEEDRQVGLAVLRETFICIDAVCGRAQSESEKQGGCLSAFESAAEGLAVAIKQELHERNKAKKQALRSIWKAALPVFEQGDVSLDVCPVCETVLANTALQTREHITNHLRKALENLEAYDEAEKVLRNSKNVAKQRQAELHAAVGKLQTALSSAEFVAQADEVAAYDEAVVEWTFGQDVPDAKPITALLKTLASELADRQREIEERQGEHTYANALIKLEALLTLMDDMKRIDATREQLHHLHERLKAENEFCADVSRNHLERVIAALRTRVKELYSAVHSVEGEIPEIYLELLKTKQAQLALLTRFASNREKVVPSGYFSDSQLHTLALSLRLSAMSFFNQGAPIIVLDDVVTSYDADHRMGIAGMLAEHFADYQVIIVTHDARFFAYLQDRLPQAAWKFMRITDFDPEAGPCFAEHRISDDTVVAAWSRGASAGNEIRQAEEEWLLGICRGFGVDIRIRELSRPYSYDRAELAEALYRFLGKRKIRVPEVKGLANPFLVSLQRGELENFCSHFQDDPNALGSIGDEKKRWTEFKQFRDMFICPNGHRRFKRPKGMKGPVCYNCEEPFSFQLPATPEVRK